MIPRFSAARLLSVVALVGIVYATWYQVFWVGTGSERARQCRVNRNLIDRYVLFWEARHGFLSGTHMLDLDTGGAVVKASPVMLLVAGSRAIAEVALDPGAFRCPESLAPGGDAVHYRWFLNPEHRGTVCVLHAAHNETSR